MKTLVLFMSLWLMSHSAHAGPNINVGVVYDYLDGSKSSYLKRIFNGGTSTAFVKVEILEIIYDANGAPREVPLQPQAGATARNGLMASPARLIVPANGMQGTRLLYMGERTSERYFRVRYIPVVPEKEDAFAVSEEEREQYQQSLAAGVSVLAGYGTVFFVRPTDTRYDTRIDNGASRYEVRNNGNSVIVVDEFKNCVAGKPNDCHPTTKNHVLPGRAFVFEKEAGRQYTFKLLEGDKQQNQEVKG
ncbi:pilus assembly protein [Pseudomonas sp. NS1(2017)]|jgi:Mat/Ecp fimbriae periplasmic chaperone|uniref:pilus assembly protein n=1 Tax=Pseudomonas sp. NS1(2017) TaxID=2025658 RepID=UPI000BA236FB|nr:pilus assembly protein [Pseudomonas sp. NS1(2017)]ASV36951.1 pilus assembly protein [Pseudomonas sp. NS1(2017)]